MSRDQSCHRQESDATVMIEHAFSHNEDEARYFKIGLALALYATLALIWLPGISIPGSLEVKDNTEINRPQKRKVLKPPPAKPLEKTAVTTKRKRKAPMPDRTPDEPEPVVAPDPPPEPTVVAMDDWDMDVPEDVPEAADTVARVGQVGVEPPIFTKQVPPVYPEKGLLVKLEGYVLVEAILRKNGVIDQIKVLRDLGKGKLGFEEAAIQALKQWEFLPGAVNSKPADVRMTLKVDFKLVKAS